MLPFGSITALAALAGSLALGTPAPSPAQTGPPSPSPTTPSPTESPTESPTGEAKVTVTPSTITTEGGRLVVEATCPDGTEDSMVTSDAFGRYLLKGTTKITVQTVQGLKAGAYKVELYCDGLEPTAQTTLTVVAATPRPTPSGPPQTGDGATQGGPGHGSLLLVTGLGLVGAGAVAGSVALRRRREGG
jgi:hypothetical protein